MTPKVDIPSFAVMCKIVASQVYDTRKPNDQYARRAAKLLFMTAAHESDQFRARRQYGFTEMSTRGAFGLLQLESGSILDSLSILSKRPALKANCEDVLAAISSTDIMLEETYIRPILLLLQKPRGDVLGAILARLHYMRVTPTPIPATDCERAMYAKHWYNTYKGKAKPEDYFNAYKRHYVVELDQ